MNHRDVMKKLLQNFTDSEIMVIQGATYFHRDLAVKYAHHGSEFTDVHGSIMRSPRFCLDRQHYVEIHPKIKIGEIEINAPFRYTPDEGTRYYFFLECMDRVGTRKWSNDTADHRFLACGNCFRSEDDANAARCAIIKLLSGE